MSCAAPGDCSAGGFYLAGRDKQGSSEPRAFTVAEVHGTWHQLRPVPGLTALNKGRNAGIDSVSCAAAGQCSAAGTYTDRAGHIQAFVVVERNGIWRRAQRVPGLAALNKGHGAGSASLNAVSCATAVSCSAGGSYTDAAGHRQVFIVSKP